MKKYRIPRKKKKLFKKKFSDFSDLMTRPAHPPSQITFKILIQTYEALEGMRGKYAMSPESIFKLTVPAPSPFLIHKNYFINP